MRSELREKTIFRRVQESAFQYIDNIAKRNVYPTDQALEGLKHFDEALPTETATAESVIDLLHTYGAPATVAGTGGRYYGFVTGSVVPAGMAAKELATFWDQNTAMQVLSPLSAKLESVVESWLRESFGLPDQTVAGFVSGTSTANFCGLVAARWRLLQRQGWDSTQKGLFGAPRIRVVTGGHAHSTVLKAINLIGCGQEMIEWVDVDEQGRIIPEKMPELDEHTLLILQAGNVNSGSFDPIDELCNRARAAGAWVHIDGAFGLWAAAVPQLAHLTRGIEKANSWAVDGHKTLNAPYDSGIVMCSDPEAIVSALHMSAGYIVLGKRDGMFYTPEMSRRSRIIELWATMKYLGKSGIEELVFGLHLRAVQFADELTQIEGYTVLNNVVFNQVIACCMTNALTEKVIAKIQELRTCWVGGSTWFGRKVIRISICSWATTAEDVSRSVQSFRHALQEMEK